MSDSSRHSLYAIPEVTYGVTPATTPAFDTVRHTGATLGITKGTFVSEEQRPDRQISDMRHGTKQTGGEIQFELSYGSFDKFLEAVLCGTWTPARTANTISAAAADNSLNDSANGFQEFEAGDKILVAGFTGAGTTANGTLTVVSRTASKIVVSGATLVDDAAGEVVTITPITAHLKAGTARRSFSVLRDFTDTTTDRFELYTGVELNTLSLTIPVEGMITGSFAAIGKGMSISNAAPAGATFTAPTTTSPLDGFHGALKEGGAAIATVTEVQFTLENGIAPRFTLGSDEAQLRASIDRSNLTGSVTVHAEDASMLKKFLNETESSLELNFIDGAGNAYKVELPRVKYNGGQRDVGKGPITSNLPFQALYDGTSASQIVITRTPHA